MGTQNWNIHTYYCIASFQDFSIDLVDMFLRCHFLWIYPPKKNFENVVIIFSHNVNDIFVFSLRLSNFGKNCTYIALERHQKRLSSSTQKQNGQNQKSNNRYKNHAQSTFKSPLTIKHQPLITYLPKMHHHQGYFRQKKQMNLKNK